MSESTATIFFITGATRGIGLALVADVVSKYPSVIVYAGAHDPSGPVASALKKIAEKHPGRVEIVKYIAADEEGNKEIARKIEEKHGRVDVVITNAALCTGQAPVHKVNIALYKDHFAVNVTGPVILFQAFYDLLKASANPKFVPITSVGGSLSIAPPIPLHSTCYCCSKAALNWVARKIHFENEWLVCFPLSPGNVDTDMLEHAVAVDSTGSLTEFIDKGGFRSPEAAASALVDIIVVATRESEGGQFIDVDGSRAPW